MSDIVGVCITKSALWDECKLFKLLTNMRLNAGSTEIEIQRRNGFSQWVLDVGDGNIVSSSDASVEIDFSINVPEEFCINSDKPSIDDLIDRLYPNLEERFSDLEYL